MQDLFACRQCHAIYAIKRRQEPPLLLPFCKVCGHKLPPSELGDWFAYERAEPEWTVDAWLRGTAEVAETENQTGLSLDDANRAVAESANKTTAELATPSNRLQQLAARVVRT